MPRRSVRSNKNTKLAAVIFLALLLVILTSLGSKFISQIFKPVELAGLNRNYTWDGNFTINLLIKNDSISVMSFDPSQKSVKIIQLPGDLYINVPGGFGRWKLESVYQLGEDERPGGGMDLLQRSIALALAIPIDGFWQFDGNLEEEEHTVIVDKIRSGPWSFPSILVNLKSNLSFFEITRLGFSLTGVRFDKVETFDLEKLGALDKISLPDGSEVLIADPVKVDTSLQEMADSRILKERVSIAVFNATTVPGLAQKAARIASNLGGVVIVTANLSSQVEATQLAGDEDSKKLLTYQRLSQAFGTGGESSACDSDSRCDTIWCKLMKVKKPQCQISDPALDNSRADINLIIGEDFHRQY